MLKGITQFFFKMIFSSFICLFSKSKIEICIIWFSHLEELSRIEQMKQTRNKMKKYSQAHITNRSIEGVEATAHTQQKQNQKQIHERERVKGNL